MAFPVAHSVLDPAAVRAVVEQVYPFGAASEYELVQAGMNDTYFLTLHGTRYVARVYRAGWRTKEAILYELELLNHLASRGVRVSVSVRARDGSLLHPLHAPEGERYLVLFTYVPGQSATWTTLEHCRRAGELLAKVHHAAEDFASPHDRTPLDLDHLIRRPLETIRPFLVNHPADWRYLSGFAERLRARLTDVSQRLDWGVCHGDFSSTGNFRVEPNGNIAVFDFDLCGPGWRISDLAPMQRAAVGYKNRCIWRSFLRGYTDTRDLTRCDLAAVPLFYAACRLWSIGMRATHTKRWGILYMDRWYVDWQLNIFRQWEAVHGEGTSRCVPAIGSVRTCD